MSFACDFEVFKKNLLCCILVVCERQSDSELLDFLSFAIFDESSPDFVLEGPIMNRVTTFKSDSLLPSFENVL